MARPKLGDAKLDVQLKFSTTRAEADRVRDLAAASGLSQQDWLRQALLAATEGQPNHTNGFRSYETPKHKTNEEEFRSYETPEPGFRSYETPKPNTPSSRGHTKPNTPSSRGHSTQQPPTMSGNDVGESTAPTSQGIGEVTSEPTPKPRLVRVLAKSKPSSNASATRADAPVAHSSIAQPETKKGKEVENKIGSSLRSDQSEALSATPVTEADDSPWQQPAAAKTSFKLADGTPVTNLWLWSNGLRMTQADVARLVASKAPVHVHCRKAMLLAWAKGLRNIFVRRWCVAHKRTWTSWRDTDRSNAAFLRAAVVLAEEYGRRGMDAEQFLDAAYEMRPKSLRFPTVDMLGGMFADRIKEWLPPEQRDYDKPWELHEDDDGHTWAQLPGESQPVLVLKNPADREHLLKINRIN